MPAQPPDQCQGLDKPRPVGRGRTFLKPEVAVPMHYNTWPKIAQDAEGFAGAAGKLGHAVRVLKPGETLEV